MRKLFYELNKSLELEGDSLKVCAGSIYNILYVLI